VVYKVVHVTQHKIFAGPLGAIQKWGGGQTFSTPKTSKQAKKKRGREIYM
jgi:hypothetical protein